MGVAREESGLLFFSSFPKSLSLWWSEESDGVLQRFERWAACARGYNRLRSARLSAGRMTMREEGPGRDRLPVERARLRRRADPDYRSNGNLDSRCLEAYGMDHSIYFKTVGEVRSERRSGVLGSGARSPPIDCGDFLSSDFDEMDSGDEGLEELGQLAAACGRDHSDGEHSDLRQRMGEIQLCRSAINEDEINNNVMTMTGLRKARRPQVRQLPAVTAQ